MNDRKPIDYSIMFAALDVLMAAELPQMELYQEIGKLVSSRPEKGAAVRLFHWTKAELLEKISEGISENDSLPLSSIEDAEDEQHRCFKHDRAERQRSDEFLSTCKPGCDILGKTTFSGLAEGWRGRSQHSRPTL